MSNTILEITETGKITFIIGKVGSGKSIIVESLFTKQVTQEGVKLFFSVVDNTESGILQKLNSVDNIFIKKVSTIESIKKILTNCPYKKALQSIAIDGLDVLHGDITENLKWVEEYIAENISIQKVYITMQMRR